MQMLVWIVTSVIAFCSGSLSKEQLITNLNYASQRDYTEILWKITLEAGYAKKLSANVRGCFNFKK